MRDCSLVRAACGSSLSVISAVANGANGAAPTATIVLFPGDISAPREEMLRDAQLAKYSSWSVEGLARRFAARWGANCHIVVVHPPRAVDGHSIYKGWLPNIDDASGDPIGSYGIPADNGSVRVTACDMLNDSLHAANQAIGQTSDGVAASTIHLVAFSHGTVVLNQILAELGRCDDPLGGLVDDGTIATLQSAASFTWLDPGLAREPGAGILLGGSALRASLHRMRRCGGNSGNNPRFHIALTPYQLQPSGWLRWRWRWSWPPLVRESEASGARRAMQRVLASEENGNQYGIGGGFDFSSEDCLTGRPATLENHFEVLNAFSAPWDVRIVP